MLENMKNKDGWFINKNDKGVEFYAKRRDNGKSRWVLTHEICLDIETSKVVVDGNIMPFITSIQVYFEDNYHLFRRPTQFMDWLLRLKEDYGLNEYRVVKIFIHNAKYDMSYLAPYFKKYLEGEPDIWLDGQAKIKYYKQDFVEVIDTLALSNRSLDKWSKDLNTVHQKKIGYYDYDKVIFQDTELTKEEMEYDKMDVVVLHECVQKQLELYDDTLLSMPITSTSYVRRFTRLESQSNDVTQGVGKKWYNYRKIYFENTKLSLQQKDKCVEAFAGGYTHGNRFLKDIVLTNVLHVDFTSFYPSQLRTKKFPIGRPKVLPKRWFEVDTLLDRCNDNDEIAVVDVLIADAELRNPDHPMPYLAAAKIKATKDTRVIKDNGRITKLEGLVKYTCTNKDLEIIKKQYKCKIKIVAGIIFEAGFLPKELLDAIDKLFYEKSYLKNVHKALEKELGKMHPKTIEALINLGIAKKALNSVYGMFATKPRDTEMVKYDGITFDTYNPYTPEEDLQKHYDSWNNFLAYQIGIMVTAFARHELFEAMELFDLKDVLYCDTDSFFVLDKPGYKEKIDEFNALHAKYSVHVDGTDIYYDQLDFESYCCYFKHLHAKCYGQITKNKSDEYELSVTIAGVTDKKLVGMYNNEPVYITREEELMYDDIEDIKNRKLAGEDIKPTLEDMVHGLERLTDGFKFRYNAGTTSKYILLPIQVFTYMGHVIETAGGCVIESLEEKVIRGTDETEQWIKTC